MLSGTLPGVGITILLTGGPGARGTGIITTDTIIIGAITTTAIFADGTTIGTLFGTTDTMGETTDRGQLRSGQDMLVEITGTLIRDHLLHGKDPLYL